MKKLTAVLTILMTSVLFTSCKKDWLELKQPGLIGTDEYFSTDKEIYEAIVAAYDPTGWQMNNVAFWCVGSVMSDDAVKGGESDGDQQGMYDLMTFSGTGNTDVVSWIYQDMYKVIARANFGIDLVNGSEDLDDATKDRYVGELKFLRAYAYFRLVRNFGGAILYRSSDDYQDKPRSTVEETYALIEEDLIDASSKLPATIANAELGRATKGAADGLLTLAYAYQRKWSEAKTSAEAVMNAGIYGLETNYSDIFTEEKQWGPEVVWAINHVEDADGGWGNAEGIWLSIWYGDRDLGWGYGFNCPTEDFVNSFETGDIRKEASIVFDGEVIPGTFGEAAHDFVGGGWNPPTGYMCQKYLIPDDLRPVTVPYNQDLDYIFLRYADILLIHAEASAELGDDASARSSLAQVRQRAGLSDYPSAGDIANFKETTLFGLSELKAVIYHERRVELGLENVRWYDLNRWGLAGTALRDLDQFGKGNFSDGCNELLPIPQNDVDVTEGLIEQNPCY